MIRTRLGIGDRNIQPEGDRVQRPNQPCVMNGRRFSLSTAFALILIAPRVVQSQEATNNSFRALTTDSTAWQRVLVYTIGALSTQLVRSGVDPTPQPWRIKVPSDDPQERLIRTQLQTILRTRRVMPSDTLVRSLEFGRLVIADDTARVEVRYEETLKCAGSGRTTGSGWSTTVLVPREPRQKFWGSARSRTTMVGDRVGC
jgi:hypothetical protein